jgi:hypothetical protein
MKSIKSIESPPLFNDAEIAEMTAGITRAGNNAKERHDRQTSAALGLTLVTEVRPFTASPRKGTLPFRTNSPTK